MKILDELLPECFLIENDMFRDARGGFTKTFHTQRFEELGFQVDMQEEYYSTSNVDVLRGMHFQRPPHHHEKLVYCCYGEVLDVLLDLREGENYGQFASVKLSSDTGLSVLIPKGIAHGFLSLHSSSIMVYKTSTVHCPESDSGVLWSSFGFDWPIQAPILSERDKRHVPFGDFSTPFE